MASKTLIRTGASLMSRLLNPSVSQNPSFCNHLLAFRSQENAVSPTLPLLLSKFQTSLNLSQNDSETIRRMSSEGFLYPCGLPSLDFFCPDGDETPNEPMILFPKRTYQPSTLRKKRNHGFFARKATRGGQRVIARRIAKGRYRITH
ncbi:uncharacterized protein LOC124945896 [Impatiens glandulifera]|uniref:uncharacterized protein LOC124945896 n=1 Tax=Impatiens glandulifera TaxID=253017 RepID=UPI001FB17CCF|nr:uncharacterized protein LOC124945896 [Impatiens glandulifera]